MKSYKIAFLNSKGGVGKSTLCILSALGLSQTRFKGTIKLIDTDSQKSSISLLNSLETKIVWDDGSENSPQELNLKVYQIEFK